MTTERSLPDVLALTAKPTLLSPQVPLSLSEYSESSFTDPHTVVSLEEPNFDEAAYSHIGKIYEGVEPYRMGGHRVVQEEADPKRAAEDHMTPTERWDAHVQQLQKRGS